MPELVAIQRWLKAKMEQRSPPLVDCLIFGSTLKILDPNDVDVMIISSEWDIRDILREVRCEFLDQFDLPLHVQIFHSSQTELIASFKIRAAPMLEVV